MEYATKNIYRGRELPEADFLMSFKRGLLKDFIQANPDYNTTYHKARPIIYEGVDASKLMDSAIYSAWQHNGIKFEHQNTSLPITQEMRDEYPTAYKLLDHYGDDATIALYSSIEPNSTIVRHTGRENRQAEYIRIHIPLIVPPGDIFFEVAGEVVDWSDIFGFDNQITHSAHNNSNRRRLVFLIDILRSRLGLPQGRPHSREQEREEMLKPFFRNGVQVRVLGDGDPFADQK